MKLHPIAHTNKSKLWCGPAAISAVTGRDTKTIHACLREVSGRDTIKGVYNSELARVLGKLGCVVSSGVQGHGLTLAAWTRQYRHLFADRPVVVNVTRHYVTVLGRSFVDNHTKRPVSLKSAPHRRKRVQSYYVIESTSRPVTWAPPARPVVDYAAIKARRGVLELARTHGIKIYDHNPGEWFVYPPDSISTEALDPYWDEHLAYDADDRAERIRRYVELLTK